jgi:branched-chain amino acid transport system ATP-binding protein
MAFLEIRNLTKHFGGLVVLRDITFSIDRGEIVGLIGPNGAGKSTLFNVIVGVHKPTEGSVLFEDEEITGLSADHVARRGIIKTYQANVSFRDLTVTENLIVGHHLQARAGLVGVMIGSATARKDAERIKSSTAKLLEMFDLVQKQNERAGELPHGYQRLLGISTAIAAKPKLLLLDEPITGMNAQESSYTVELIRRLRESGITIIIVEHNMNVVMNLCERIVVLHFGKKIAEGSPEAIRGNKDVIEAYLGVE